MIIRPIFEVKDPKLWGVCYEKNSKGGWLDCFNCLMDKCSDTEYVMEFVLKYKEELNRKYWRDRNMTVDKVIDQVLDEVDYLDQELLEIDSEETWYERKNLDSIFEPYHEGIYRLKKPLEKDYRKGKATVFHNPLIRIYAICLNDGTMIISGGIIKLTQKMGGSDFESETQKLHDLRRFLKLNEINDVESLRDYLDSH